MAFQKFFTGIDIEGEIKALYYHETTDVDKFLVSSSGEIKYRTGAEVLSDIDAASSSHNHAGVYLPIGGGTLTGTLSMNSTYVFPITAGTSGQALIFPDSGTTLEWGTPWTTTSLEAGTVTGQLLKWTDGIDHWIHSDYTLMFVDTAERSGFSFLSLAQIDLNIATTRDYSILVTKSDATDTSIFCGIQGTYLTGLYGFSDLSETLSKTSIYVEGNAVFEGIKTSATLKAYLPHLTSNGFVKTSGSNGELTIDTSIYIVNPMTTAGDIIYGGVSGALTRLGIGTDGYVLTVASGAPAWVINAPMVYPGAGIALSTGSSWDTSITNNSSDWNTAYGWGNHAGLYYGLVSGITIDTVGIAINSDDAFYLGDPDSDGTWRIIRETADLTIERRESGSYVTKSKIMA